MLFDDLNYVFSEDQSVLGINLGYGDDLFQLKGRILENTPCKNVKMTHFEHKSLYKPEMIAFLDEYQSYHLIEELLSKIGQKTYHYIISNIDFPLSMQAFEKLTQALNPGGILVINNKSVKDIDIQSIISHHNQKWTYIVNNNSQ